MNRDEAEALLIGYFATQGYPDCFSDGQVVKVEQFQNGLALQMALYKTNKEYVRSKSQLYFEVYYKSAPKVRSVCEGCIGSMKTMLEKQELNWLQQITPTDKAKAGVYVYVATKWQWRNITEDNLKSIRDAYVEFRDAFEPCFAGVSHVGEGRQVQFKGLSDDTAKHARSLYHSNRSNRELVDLVISCKPAFNTAKYDDNKKDRDGALKRFKDSPEMRTLRTDYLGVNAFKVLKMGEHEIRHSNMLGWLLDARESHEKDTRFLDELVGKLREEVKKQKDSGGIEFEEGAVDRLERDLDLKDFVVHREDDNEDIKLRSYANRLIIVIENKWNADAGKNQLKTYADRVEAEIARENNGLKENEKPRWTAVFAYLTLTGERTEKSKDDNRWIALSYRDIKSNLKKYLEEAAKSGGEMSPADALITQYYRVLEMKPELMEPKDRLVNLCEPLYCENALAFELMFQSDTLYFNNSISKILEDLSCPGEGIVTSYVVGSGVAKLRLAALNRVLDRKADSSKKVDKYPYYVELELHSEKQDRVCCNLKKCDSSEKKEKTIQWYDKAKKKKNWKPFVYAADGESDSFENAVRDAISELVDLVKKDPDYFRDQLIGNRANGQDDD